MKTLVDIVKYTTETGLEIHWDDDAVIEVHQSHNTTIVKANASGLATLARFLLTLAQEGVPEGSHWHLDEHGGLEEGSSELIISRFG